ncbi:MAG: F0F1 ATP synthase subunit epsilon [Dehalococcoidales bacterium]|jgi:F-type H+-transporting ATPase subunit epsilon|nr:F0F1 ATP synthase subunit epsilon [Dehalococcoidales bacterium]MDP7109373.1 F0F1 ATP synthase subunit epsilon [Dehalococcoidales bacterium]MDP7309782.1 F0F1 ATP synthase subunit epsilon [Dehalococcoidales bacterium]MDP7409812.1 F0F1 ATP synthase subunit epsilon [Dehalococcoidales bacterium]MDP7676093.1 F0F1 ATP synthase subunit epsilon [Dehalococcoidales bacterium]|tara:strand:- start:208 stop:630 length:423 start_codon:yes stop_codon:yes gene_type:complete
MTPIRLEIVTAQREVFSEEVDTVVVPGIEGTLGILPHHAPLMTSLETGELSVRKGSEEFSVVISGGFLEVRPDRVIVLADVAERAEEIDLARAEEAKLRAHEELVNRSPRGDLAQADAALRRALVRLKVGERRRRQTPRP